MKSFAAGLIILNMHQRVRAICALTSCNDMQVSVTTQQEENSQHIEILANIMMR